MAAQNRAGPRQVEETTPSQSAADHGAVTVLPRTGAVKGCRWALGCSEAPGIRCVVVLPGLRRRAAAVAAAEAGLEGGL